MLTLPPFVALLLVLPFPHTVAVRLLCLLLAFVIALALGRRDPELWRRFPPGRWGIALWILVCGLSLFYSVDPRYTLNELRNEIGYTLVAFYSFYVMGQRRQHAQALLRSLALGLLLIGCISICSWITNDFVWLERGIQGGVGSFSTYIVTCMPALFWLSLEDSSARWRWLARILIVFALVLAFLTLQRAVWLALDAELLIALYLLHRCGRLRIRIGVLLGLIAVMLAASTLSISVSNKMRGYYSIFPSAQTFDIPLALLDGSDGDARIAYWPAVLQTIVDHPLTGSGFGQGLMKKAYPELVPPNFTSLWHAHNTILNYAIQMGIPGALALLLMFFGLARHFLQRLRENPACATAAIAGVMLLAGVLLRNQTNDFFRRDLALLFWCLIGIFSALVLSRKTEQ